MKEILETIDFEGLATPGSPELIPDGYDGFHWSAFGVIVSQDLADMGYGSSGYVNDLQSGDSVAYVSGDVPTTMSADRPFRLVDGYFAAAWNIGMTVTVDGYRDGVQVAEKHFIVDDTSSTLFHFGRSFRRLDSVSFTSSGGTTDPNSGATGSQIVLEDLKVRAPPFPASSSVHHDAVHHDAVHHLAEYLPASDTFAV